MFVFLCTTNAVMPNPQLRTEYCVGKDYIERLGMQWFKNRIYAKVAIEDWCMSYNQVRPHSSLNNLTPAQYARNISTRNPEPAIL
jgi:putative transposase